MLNHHFHTNQPTQVISAGPDTHAMKLVVLEDNETFATLLKLTLEKANFTHVEVFHHPDDLLAQDDLQPDLVILDVNLPGKNGFTVMQELRGRFSDDEYIPIIFLTSDERVQLKQYALELGAHEFLSKSNMTAELIVRVKNLLESRKLHLTLHHKRQELELSLAQREQELEQANLEMLIRLAHAAESSHIFKGDQIWKVASLSAQLAIELGLDDDYVSLILRAARLHDIGKISLPAHILLKPSKLTEAEFELVKTHTTVGAQLLSGGKYPSMQLAESIALTHHERWDGQGYPRGLKAQEIPIEGRILAVADTFYALTHDRPFKAKLSLEDAVAEIKSCSAKQFDPNIVDALMRLYAKGELDFEASFKTTLY